MKIVYSLPHPSHRLDTPGAGHTVRANALLHALESLGCEVIRDQAAKERSQAAAKTYRQFIKKLVPRPIAMNLRDRARVQFGKQYGERLAAVVAQHKPDVILQTHIAYSLSGKIAAEANDTPLVLDDVAPSWEEEREYGSGNVRLARSTHQAVTEAARLCVAVCGPMHRFLLEDGIAAEKLITVSNAIRADIFKQSVSGEAVRQRYGLPPQSVVIVFVGSFQPYHRVDWLLEAFSKVQAAQDVRLLLVGDGRERENAQRYAQTLDIAERVVFSGHVDYSAVPEHIAAGDIAVIPAHAAYTNPMKLYEYMAMGKATIAPNQETIIEIGTHGTDLYTFAPEDVNAMAQAIQQLAENASLRQKLGDRAREAIAQGHTWRNRAQKLLAEMERVL